MAKLKSDCVQVSEEVVVDSAMFSSEDHPENFPDGGLEAYTVLLGSFCGLIADFGIMMGMGAIQTYVTKNQLANYKASTVSWIFSLNLGIVCLGGVVFGDLFDRYGAKKLLIAGTAFMFTGLLTLAESKELYQFILSFGILTAIGISLAMAPLIGVISHWFLKKRAVASSVATIGGLLGSSVFVVMLQSLYSSVGFKWAIRSLAFICLACMFVSILLVKERIIEPSSQETTSDELNIKEDSELSVGIQDEGHQSIVFPKRDKLSGWSKFIHAASSNLKPLKNVRFVSLALGVILAELNSMTILTYLPLFASDGGVSERKSYLLLTIASLSGIPARLATGLLADKYGRFNIMLLTSFFSMVFIWGLLMTFNGRLSVLYVFAVLYGISNSAVFGLVAACLSQICPARHFGRHYGVLYFCLTFFIVSGIFLTSLVINTRSEHDYKMWIVLEGCISIVCVAAWIWARWCNVRFRWCKY